jgi:hypothetical protein
MSTSRLPLQDVVESKRATRPPKDITALPALEAHPTSATARTTARDVNFPLRSGHSCCLLLVVDEVLFVLDRGPVLQGAVESVGVVPDEPFEHRGASVGSGGEVFVVDEFAFQRSEERLGHGVVVTVTDGAHRLGDTELAARVAVGVGGLLTAVVAVKDHPTDAARPTAGANGGVEGVET